MKTRPNLIRSIPRALLFSYCTISAAVFLTFLAFADTIVDMNLFVGLLGCFLALFQIALAFHVYLLQNAGAEELSAIGEIFKIEGGRETMRTLYDYGSVSLTMIVRKTGMSKEIVSHALGVLEEKKIVFSKPSFAFGKASRIYFLNRKFKRIIGMFRFAF